MLNINTQVNFPINIGENMSLTVLNIDKANEQVLMSISDNSVQPIAVREFTMEVGKDVHLCEDVQLYCRVIEKIGMEYVILSFDAPRSIIIRGSWNKDVIDNKNIDDTKKLAKMHDTSLVYYASTNAKTPLEIELFNRFKKTVG